MFDRRAFFRIVSGHRGDQILHEFETIALLWAEMRSFTGVREAVACLHKLLSHKVANVIYVSLKRITASPPLMFRRRLVSTSQRFVQCISGGILARQTKVNEEVAGRALRPSISFCNTLEVPISIDLDRVKPIRIHFRRIEHDVVSCAITS